MKSLIPALTVANMSESLRFYTELLDFETTITMPGENGELVHAGIKRGDVELMLGPASANPQAGPVGLGVSLYTTVADDEDIDAFFARVKNAGVTVVQEPMDQFWGHRDWTIKDPDGYHLTISKVVRAFDPSEFQAGALATANAD